MAGFEAVRVSEHVFWVGAIDWSVRDFHGYSTPRGTTYNAFLVMGEQPVLVDTVKAPFVAEMMARIGSVTDPANIKVIISHHSEMDHSGALPEVVATVKPEKVYASVMGVKNLHDQHLDPVHVAAVKDGETLKLGGLTFTFLETRMLHWPDSMVSYLHEDELVFSQDGFGMHLASSARFADECDLSMMEYEAKKYFANILLPYAPLVTKLLERIKGLGINIKTIAPDHGPVWRRNPAMMLNWWAEWAKQRPENRAVIVYDTMWQSTALMARAIADGLASGGTRVSVVPMQGSSRAELATELLGAGALLVGSPTINNGLFPSLADSLTYVRGLKPKNLIGAAFGSYGWSGEGPGQAEDYLKSMGVELVAPALKQKFVPDDAALARCRELGSLVSTRLRERAGR
ncbi:FprA family A-type flavoprotein [candidate division WOR-3 bacterium]|nr:FprA family A-type flavoprotein [candidate division WOR-3 bacterium]